MKEIVLSVLLSMLFVICGEGVGQWIYEKSKMEKRGYLFPLGIAVIFSALEILYLPVLVFSLPAVVANGLTWIVMIASVCLTLPVLPKVFQSFVKRDSLPLAASIVLYVFIFLHSSDLSIGLAELSFASQNSFTNQVSFLSPLQGYQLLQAVMLRYLSRTQLLLCLGCLYHFVFGGLCLNILRTLRLKNPWFSFTLMLYALFYTGFNDWQIARSSNGANWRVIFVALILWTIYFWLKEEDEKEKYTLLVYMSAGCFVSGGFAIISFEILYGLAVYLFHMKKTRSLFDMSTLLIPYGVYYGIRLGMVYPAAGIAVLICILAFVLGRYTKNLRRIIRRTEEFLFEHGRRILLIEIPVIVAVLSVVLSFMPYHLTVPYSFYAYFVTFEPTKSYLFLDHSVLTWILDIFRWSGLIVLVWKGKNPQDRQLKDLFLTMIVLFLNPLSMGLVARFVGIDVYAYTFEILFNPFTDLLLFVTIYQVFEWHALGQWILELFLVAACVIGHVGSFAGIDEGLYTSFVKDVQIGEVIE